MEALLSGLDDGPKTHFPCNSIEELQQQLRGQLDAAITPSRANHVSVTFDFRATVNFTLSVPESENEALENGGNVDPNLVDARASIAPGGTSAAPHAAVSRIVRASETLLNQPQDNPVLQRAVAKHLITALGIVDGSNWIVREMSRGVQGWTFVYICKDSDQAWKRQNSKHVAKSAIAEYSVKELQDPVHLSRPAFDCRGSVTISFIKANRTIQVKYEHTALHKSVSQLIELFAPPPPPSVKRVSGVGVAGKTPKKSQSRRKTDDAEASGADGERPKKRRKKSGGDGEPQLDPDGNVIEGSLKKKRVYKKKPEKSSGADGDGLDSATAASGGSNPPLNLPPGEAERRRAVASALLEGHGIDPATLSEDQMLIFANQSPDLQKESLAMLVKYGAERLRIVHPTKDGDRSSASPAAANGRGASDDSTSALGKKMKTPLKKKSDVNGDESGADGATPSKKPALGKTAKVKRTRGACSQCRERKQKCSKAKPRCDQCVDLGMDCFYPPMVSKKKADDDSDEQIGEAEEAGPQPEIVQVEEDEPDDLRSRGFYGANADSLPLGQNQPPDYYSLSQANLSYMSQTNSNGPVMDYNQNTTRAVPDITNTSGLTFPTAQPASPSQYPDPEGLAAPPTSAGRNSRASKNSRTSLLRAPKSTAQWTASQPASLSPLANNHNNTTTTTTTTTNGLSAPLEESSVSRHRSRKSTSKTVVEDGLQNMSALSQAAVQHAAQQSPHVHQQTPPQANAQPSRAKSRQANSGQASSPPREHAMSIQQQTQVPAAQSSYDAAAATSNDVSGLPAFDGYSHQQPSGAAEQSTSRNPYAGHRNHETGSNTYLQSFNPFTTRSTTTTTTTSTPSTAASGLNAPSYPPPSTTNNSWSSNTDNHQARDTAAQPSTINSSSQPYGTSTARTQSPALQGFNVRPRAPTSSRSTTQPQPQSHQPHYTQPEQSQQQSTGYSVYGTQQANHISSSNQQQNWYGFTAANAGSSSLYNNSGQRATGTAASSASYQNSRYNQHNQHHLHPQQPGWG